MAGKEIEIAIPIFHHVTALDAIGPYDVLQCLPNVQIKFVSHQKGLLRAFTGSLSLQSTTTFDQVPHPDVIIVPGGPGTTPLMDDPVILDWIRNVHETTLFTTAVCTGSHLLAAAGLLKGLEATTHWNTYDVLAKYGAKPIAKRVVRQGKILTAAGVSSGIDMGLVLAALLSDDSTAKAAQLVIEYDPQPPFDCGSVEKAGPEVVAHALQLAKAKISSSTD